LIGEVKMISINQVLRSIGLKTFSETCNSENIYGLEKEKQALMMALTAKRSCHVLLVGPPGIGKTDLVLSIYNANRSKAYFTYGGHSTKAGMVDQLFHDRPRILVVDELETMSSHDQVSLLGLCENGILAETKITKTRQTQMNVWVFATSNCTKRISTTIAADPMKHPYGVSVSKSSGTLPSDAGRMPPDAPPGR
jgi:Holliday junction resolvasome RuvABC ATP-dependent DNA helicase subunit